LKTGIETGVTHNTGNRNGIGWLGWRETTYLRDRGYRSVGSFILIYDMK
jgi:hypothetical protein